MKLKGISPLEQNVDRIVLGVVGLALVGAVGLQFLPEKTIKVGTSPREVKPTQAMSVVEEEARTVSGKLDAASLPTPEVAGFALNDRLALGSAYKLAARAGQAPLGRAPELGGSVMAVRQESDMFALPAVPAPTAGVASIVQVTISPVEKLKNPDLAKLLPEAQPFDKTSVSVEFAWSGAQLREGLQSDPDGEGPAVPLPLNWWRDQAGGGSFDLVDIVAVQYERETITKADGKAPATPETVILAAPPGRPGKLEEWKTTVKGAADVAQVMLPAVQEFAEDIQRPPFYQVIAGPEWVPPSKAVVAGSQAGKVVELNRERARLADVDRRIADLEKRLAEAGAAADDKRQEREQPPPSRPGGGKGGAGPAAPGGGDRTPEPKQAPKGDARVIDQQLKRAQAEREAILKRLAALGEPVPGMEQADTQARPATLDNPDVRVWTHDMTAEPGATYRYRARVVINNPLFGRNLQAKQAELAQQQLVEGAWSEWTQPVMVPRSSYFFITSASEGDPQISPQPTAGAEMYVFKYGFYRKASVQLNPGDSLFGEARMPKTLKYADMQKLQALLEDPNAADAAAPVAPAPGGKGGAGVAAAPIAQNPSQPAGPLDAAWTTPVPESEAIAMDVTFLDASPLPTADRGALGIEQVRIQTTFRDELGRILVMSPEMSKSDIYERVSKSAEAGRTQGEVIVKAPEDKPRPTVTRPDREREAPRRQAPAGGGG